MKNHSNKNPYGRRTLHYNPEIQKSQKIFHPYFRQEGIDSKTQCAFRRHFMLVTGKGTHAKAGACLSFPLTSPTDEKHKVKGFEQRYRPNPDGRACGRNTAGCDPSASWIANLSGKPLEETDKILWFESAYEAMAYHQLLRLNNKDTKAVYVSTAGKPTDIQFKALASAAPGAVHHLHFETRSILSLFEHYFDYCPETDFLDRNADPESEELTVYLLPKEIKKLCHDAEHWTEEYFSASQSRLVCKEDLEEIRTETTNALKKYKDAIRKALPSAITVSY